MLFWGNDTHALKSLQSRTVTTASVGFRGESPEENSAEDQHLQASNEWQKTDIKIHNASVLGCFDDRMFRKSCDYRALEQDDADDGFKGDQFRDHVVGFEGWL